MARASVRSDVFGTPGADIASVTGSDRSQRVASGVQPRPGRILVIDDEEQVARSIARVLSSEHDVTVVTEAMDALARLKSGEQYDVILCDIMMPIMNGAELLAEVAAVIPEEAARIVFVTGGALLPHVREFLDRVPNACLEKPLDIGALRAFVARRVRGGVVHADRRSAEVSEAS